MGVGTETITGIRETFTARGWQNGRARSETRNVLIGHNGHAYRRGDLMAGWWQLSVAAVRAEVRGLPDATALAFGYEPSLQGSFLDATGLLLRCVADGRAVWLLLRLRFVRPAGGGGSWHREARVICRILAGSRGSGRAGIPARRCRAGMAGSRSGGWRRVRLPGWRRGRQRQQVQPRRGGHGVAAFAGPDRLDGEPGVVPAGPPGGDEPQRVAGDVPADHLDGAGEGGGGGALAGADARR